MSNVCRLINCIHLTASGCPYKACVVTNATAGVLKSPHEANSEIEQLRQRVAILEKQVNQLVVESLENKRRNLQR